MIAVVLLLSAAGLAAAGMAWLVREVTKADRQRIAEAWVALADVQRHIDEARVVHAEQRLASDAEWQAPTFEQCYNRVEVEALYEMFALPAADVWEDGQEIRRRGGDR